MRNSKEHLDLVLRKLLLDNKDTYSLIQLSFCFDTTGAEGQPDKNLVNVTFTNNPNKQTKQNKAKSEITKQNKTRQNKTKQNK